MNASRTSLFALKIVFALNCFLFVNAYAMSSAEAGDCVMTENSCPCSEMPAPGACVNHKGNNQCSMGTCKPSYRCDCLGYEMCKRSACAIYVGNHGVVPSDTGLFPCQLSATGATCTTFDYVMDTVVAIDNIYTAVLNANDESSAQMMEAYEFVAEIEHDIIAVNEALKHLGDYRNRIAAQEMQQLEEHADDVISFVADSGKLALEASHEAEMVYKASRDVADLRHQVKVADQKEKASEKALGEEQRRAEGSGEECTNCASLRDEIEKSKKARKEATLEAAEIAKKSREHNRNAGGLRNKVEANRARATEGKQALLLKIDEIKKRVINVDI